MSKSKRTKTTTSQKVLWLVSFLIAASMVLSLIIVALPSGPAPTPVPTLTPSPRPALTEPPAAPTSAPTPTLELTEPVIGPMLPTGMPELTVTVTPTLTVSE